MNLYLEVILDYTTDRHAATRQRLADHGIDQLFIVPTLEDVWRDNNAEQQESCDEKLCQEAHAILEAERLAAKEAVLHCQVVADELKLVKQEEWKKYKNKYSPIPNTAVPMETIIIPSAYAMNKLCKGEYCKLYYFTNRGLAKDKSSLPSLDDDALMLMKSENSTHSFIALSSTKAKASLVKDKALSWEEVGQANFRMINAMHQCEWADMRVQMHINLWLTIETHEWHHNTSPFNKAALLTYQACVRQLWHRTIGSLASFDLAILNPSLLTKTRDELVRNASMAQIASMQQVCPLPLSNPLSNIYFHFHLQSHSPPNFPFVVYSA
ncbi:hypothetical protein PAXRUDRAFT_165570 [Paxillus rubicundulus Ve08.2h10]|uniref:Uncharacterized protein n=1 Tax=Paxillus rubicundulus Ve08.2h10 TaxID=930991 RepID=A0A0D0D2U6_9AGAM|nr:hypothetical protein PAXRUDRAFT_165570 [Paxillus rubicundulus Ve08.2h10]